VKQILNLKKLHYAVVYQVYEVFNAN